MGGYAETVTYMHARTYARSIVHTRMQFAQMNGLMMHTWIYKINASNAMPNLYLHNCVH